MIAGVLLAAGAGRRYGGPKALVDGWLVGAVAALRDGGCDPVIVVLGAGADRAAALVPTGAIAVVADDWADGMGASLRAGLARLAPDVSAAVVHLVDLPDVGAQVVGRVRAAVVGPASVVRARYGDRPGHPVALGRDHWPAITAGPVGDRGARDWLTGRDDLVLVDCTDLATGVDVDTPR